MAKLGEPKATENQALLGPDIVMVASPPDTLAFSLTFEDNAVKRMESMLKCSWNSLVSLSGQVLPHRIQQTSEMSYDMRAGGGRTGKGCDNEIYILSSFYLATSTSCLTRGLIEEGDRGSILVLHQRTIRWERGGGHRAIPIHFAVFNLRYTFEDNFNIVPLITLSAAAKHSVALATVVAQAPWL